MAASVMKFCRLQQFFKLGCLNTSQLKTNYRLTTEFRNHSSVSGERDGKTTVTIINKDQDLLLINAFSAMGFRLNNNLMAVGPIAIFPKTVLSWNVKSIQDINENSLSLFCLLEPKIDILVIGTGDKMNRVPDSIRRILISKKFSFEILPTDQACATFNFLNSEGRYVAGALIPPTKIKLTDEDRIDSKTRRDKLFISDE